MTNPLEEYLVRLKSKPAPGATGALLTNPVSPDEAARGFDLGTKLGKPPAVVLSDMDRSQFEVDQRQMATDLEGAPRLQAWLERLENAALAKDDLANLSWFERQGGALARAAGRGARQVAASAPYTRALDMASRAADIGKTVDDLYAENLAGLGGESIPDFMKASAYQRAQMRYDELQGMTEVDRLRYIQQGADSFARASKMVEVAQGIPLSDAAASFRDGALSEADDTLEGTFAAFLQDPIGAAAFLGETAAETLPVLAAATATTVVTRSPAAGAVTMGAGGFTRENVVSAMDFLAEKGVRLETEADAIALLANRELLGEMQERGLTRAAVIAAFDVVSGGVAGKVLAESPAGDAILQGIAQVALGAGGEAAAQLASGQEFSIKEVVIEGLAELATAPIEVVGVGGRGLIRQLFGAVRSGDGAGAVDAVVEQAAASKVRDRAPAQFRDVLAQIADGEVFVPADGLREYFQAKDLSAEDWGIDRADFEASAEAGANVAISVADIAGTIQDMDDIDWIRGNAVLEPDELSANEAQRFNEEVAGIIQGAVEEAESAYRQEQSERVMEQQVFDNVFSQLRAAGRGPDVARNEAAVWQAFFRTMALRYDGDIEGLAARFGFEIRGPLQGEYSRRRGEVDRMLNTLRSQGDRALRPQGPGVLEFVQQVGGVRDIGGDVEAMGVPSGVIAETAAQGRERAAQPSLGGMPTQARGIPLDQLGGMLIDAGYFPEYAGGANINPDGTVVDEATIALQAITEAVQGRERYQPGDGPDQDLADLATALDDAGIDAALPNDEIVAALEAADGQTSFQDERDPDDMSIDDVFDEFSSNIKSATDNAGTFDRDDPNIYRQERRGSIVLPRGGLTEGQTVINLFESADLSTFLHESGHFFLEAFGVLATAPDAPQALREDLQVINKFLGVEDGSTLSRDQHETWARGFEAYLLEGKAPSLELASAFARFKAWLTRIYRNIAGLNVKLTPEIREVMDRMLATDAEISEARSTQQMSPLFASPPPGMSDADFATYQRIARQSEEQAQQRLLEKTMGKVRREREKWYREERKEVMAEVEAEVDKRRESRLVDMLANGVWRGSDEQVPDIRIDRTQLVDMYGKGVLEEINRTQLGGKRAIYTDDGETMSPREAASMFGFSGPNEMIEVLQNTDKRRDAITLETDRRMIERHGDPLNDGSIEEEALIAIHSEQSRKSVVSEVRYLAGRLGRDGQRFSDRIYAARARAMIGRMSAGQASKPSTFLTAERRAARKAQDAFSRIGRQGGEAALAEAFQAKEQQALNMHLFRESKRVEKEVQRGREKMRAYEKASVRSKLEGGYIEQIDALLDGYDFRVRSQRAVSRDESLRDFQQRMIDEGREAELAIDQRLLDQAGRKHYTRLSVEELRGLFDTVQNIDHLGRLKMKLIERNRRRNLLESVGRVQEAILGSQKIRETDVKRRGLEALNLLRKPDTIMIALDDGNEFGPVYQEIKRGIDDGASAEQRMQMETAERFQALFDAHYKGKALRRLRSEVAVNGVSKAWTREQIIALALNMGNEDNSQRALDSSAHPDVVLTRDEVDLLAGQLDENDWRFVQGMWDLIDSYWPELSAVHKRRTGQSPRKVDAKPMVAAPSFVRGGYYPIKYDPTKGAAASRDEASAWDRFLTAGHGAAAAVANGMTKQRERSSGGRSLLYDLSVPFAHLRETTRFIALSEAVDASYRVLNHPDVVAAMQNTGNADTHKTLNLWLQDVARGPVFNSDFLNTAFRMAKNNFTMSRLAFNMKTTVLQATGLGQSAATIGKRAMLKGMLQYARRPQKMVQHVMDVSPLMAERQSTFQKDIYDFVNEAQAAGPMQRGASKLRNRAAQVGFWQIQATQFYAVDMPTWLGAYQAAIDEGKSEVDATLIADRGVVRAQDSGLLSDRSAVERGTVSQNTRQSDVIRFFTTLGGYMLTKLNRAYVTGLQAKRGIQAADSNLQRLAVATNAATDLGLLFIFEAALMGLIYSVATEDEDDEDLRNFILRETGAAVVGGVPLVRDAAAAFKGYGGGGIYGSVLEVPANLYTQAAQGENDAAFRRAIGDVLGIATGLPTTASLRAYEGILGEGDSFEAFFGRNPLAN